MIGVIDESPLKDGNSILNFLGYVALYKNELADTISSLNTAKTILIPYVRSKYFIASLKYVGDGKLELALARWSTMS